MSEGKSGSFVADLGNGIAQLISIGFSYDGGSQYQSGCAVRTEMTINQVLEDSS